MPEDNSKLLIVGLGGQAHVIASIAAAQGYAIKGFIDPMGEPERGIKIRDLPVLAVYVSKKLPRYLLQGSQSRSNPVTQPFSIV